MWLIITDGGFSDNNGRSRECALPAARLLHHALLFSQIRVQYQHSQPLLQVSHHAHPHSDSVPAFLPHHRRCKQQKFRGGSHCLLACSVPFFNVQSGSFEAYGYFVVWERLWWSLLEKCSLDIFRDNHFARSNRIIRRSRVVFVGNSFYPCWSDWSISCKLLYKCKL